MLLTSVISGNKLVDLLSCIVVKPAYHNWKSQASRRFGFQNRFVSRADVKDNAAQSNTGGGVKMQKVSSISRRRFTQLMGVGAASVVAQPTVVLSHAVRSKSFVDSTISSFLLPSRCQKSLPSVQLEENNMVYCSNSLCRKHFLLRLAHVFRFLPLSRLAAVPISHGSIPHPYLARACWRKERPHDCRVR